MKIGRPKLTASEKKGQITGVRLCPDERDLLERAASFRKQTLSNWLRETVVSTARRQIKGHS